MQEMASQAAVHNGSQLGARTETVKLVWIEKLTRMCFEDQEG